jgi:hypothetical protein
VSLLAVDDLTVAFSTLRARLTVLEGVRFDIGSSATVSTRTVATGREG